MPSYPYCEICKHQLNNFKYKTMPQWNISGYLCGTCYSSKLMEYYHPQKEDKNDSKTLGNF